MLHADVYARDGKPFEVIPGESPLHGVTRWETTDCWQPRARLDEILRARFAGHDRLIHVTDHAPAPQAIDLPETVACYRWWTTDYANSCTYSEPEPPWLTFHGCSDESLTAIQILEAAQQGRWPWEAATAPR
ncbi:hypothetical protein [Kibdelosporangium phytohabitans]|uniref:Uncharacterized protein n=1 Tax=Kibdelosporangium phytohabitans TaxID=860235 RepID=A0A0N9I3P6_9PSEU|nr:hypothetical protein [Kibdelosporangium phytohabitans]ALG10285.1 hypothetical protein AOZ06_28345 [Kibdelosporangium phytohabitans]MBE1461315.1 hypothetical protein [Kibdelosporangium phytohabitans]